MHLIGLFGTGRNGSSLLTRLMDGLSNAYVHPVEVNFLSALNDLARQKSVSRATKINSVTRPLRHLHKPVNTDLLLKSYEFQLKDMQDSYISQLNEMSLGVDPVSSLQTRPSYLPSDFAESFLYAMSKWTNGNMHVQNYIFKTIETPYIEDYEKLFPDMKFIHIIRNPVDVYSSAKRGSMLGNKLPLWYFAGDLLTTFIIKRWLSHAKTILSRMSSDRHYLIRYEDLITNPLGAISKICDWLNVSLPAEPTKQTVLGGQFIKLPSNPSKKGVETPIEVVSDLSSKYNYENVIEENERNLIIYITYLYAKELGYFENLAKPAKSKVIKSWIAPEKWELMHSNNIMDLGRSCYAVLYRRVMYFREIMLRG